MDGYGETITVYKKKWSDEPEGLGAIGSFLGVGIIAFVISYGPNLILYILLFILGGIPSAFLLCRAIHKAKKKNELVMNGKLLMARINYSNTKGLECSYMDQATNRLYIFKDGFGSGCVGPVLLNANPMFAKLIYIPVIVNPDNYNEYIILIKDVLFDHKIQGFGNESMKELRICMLSNEDLKILSDKTELYKNATFVKKSTDFALRLFRNISIFATILVVIVLLLIEGNYFTYLFHKQDLNIKTAVVTDFDTDSNGKYVSMHSDIVYEIERQTIQDKIDRDVRDRKGTEIFLAFDESGKIYRMKPFIPVPSMNYFIILPYLLLIGSYLFVRNGYNKS